MGRVIINAEVDIVWDDIDPACSQGSTPYQPPVHLLPLSSLEKGEQGFLPGDRMDIGCLQDHLFYTTGKLFKDGSEMGSIGRVCLCKACLYLVIFKSSDDFSVCRVQASDDERRACSFCPEKCLHVCILPLGATALICVQYKSVSLLYNTHANGRDYIITRQLAS
jgi:hypothetical protein